MLIWKLHEIRTSSCSNVDWGFFWEEGIGREQISPESVFRLSVNNNYVTAELIYSTVHAHRKIFSWSRLPCVKCLCEHHLEKPWRVVYGYVVLNYGCCASQERRKRLQFLRLLGSPSASQLTPCLPWAQPTVLTVWKTRQLALWAGSAVERGTGLIFKLMN